MRTKRLFIAACVILTVLFCAVAEAEETLIAHPPGTLELRLETMPGIDVTAYSANKGAYLVAGDNTSFALGLKGGVGYFLQPNVEIGGVAGINILDASLDADGTLVGVPMGLFCRYLIRIQPRLDAFAEGMTGFIISHWQKTDVSGDFGAKVGVDYLVSRNAAIFGALTLDILVADNIDIPVGITYGFRIYLD